MAIINLNMPDIWQTEPDREQNVQFQLDQIQNGRLEVIIDINMDNIWKTMPDS